VGIAVLAGIFLAVAGAIWLSEARFGRGELLGSARFKSIGGLGVGDPVMLRGVRIGRVKNIALGVGDWVDVDFELDEGIRLPQGPVAIIFSSSMFGDWSVQVLSDRSLPDDPEVRRQVTDAVAAGRDRWPGATLPDVGQLTAEAGRIAGSIAIVANRFQDAFDSTSAVRLKQAFTDLSRLSGVLSRIARDQERTLGRIGGNLDTGTSALARSALALSRTVARADSATDRAQLRSILNNTEAITADIRTAAGDIQALSGAARQQQETFTRIVARADSLLEAVQQKQGTLGLLLRDTTLYAEATSAVQALRQLLADIQRNPRRYFSFSVF
jgi:phospholipid/cholesterol/gamma-HCH transport system substrate-binding protein